MAGLGSEGVTIMCWFASVLSFKCDLQAKKMPDKLASGRSSFGADSHKSSLSTNQNFDSPVSQKLATGKPHEHGEPYALYTSSYDVMFGF